MRTATLILYQMCYLTVTKLYAQPKDQSLMESVTSKPTK